MPPLFIATRSVGLLGGGVSYSFSRDGSADMVSSLWAVLFRQTVMKAERPRSGKMSLLPSRQMIPRFG